MHNLNLDLIKEKRLKLNISQQEMADYLGFKNASTYMKYEKGIYSFKANHVPLIAKQLNSPIESLFLNRILL
ncbi:MAG: helix-turn-helix transcriptional regulator [Bacillota bacterium]|nr:helix-turn-helix transcriptional regulator [Bacillota bacterium]